MTALYNTLSDDTTVCNYVNPLIKGELLLASSYNLATLFTERFGVNTSRWVIENVGGTARFMVRIPAGGLETKTGAISYASANYRWWFDIDGSNFLKSSNEFIDTNNSNSRSHINIGTGTRISGASERTFFCLNDYAFLMVSFTDASLSTLAEWRYIGWTKDIPSFYNTATVYPRTFTFIKSISSQYLRITTENTTSGTTTISTASDAITNPTLNCSVTTAGANSGDCKLRDASAPNYCFGKLHHIITVNASNAIGSVIKDQNGQAYIVFVNWGSERLAFKAFAEGYA